MYRGWGEDPDCETNPAIKSIGPDTWDLPGVIEYTKFKCRERNHDFHCPFFKARPAHKTIPFPALCSTEENQ